MWEVTTYFGFKHLERVLLDSSLEAFRTNRVRIIGDFEITVIHFWLGITAISIWNNP